MAQAPAQFPDRIAAVSDRFKNAVVDVLDPSLLTSSYDPNTNTMVQSGNPVVVSGVAARVQPVRLAVDTRGSSTGNPSGEVRMRVQLPREAVGQKVKRGWLIRVTAADRNPELLDYVLVVDSEVNSSWRASLTVEATVNVENEADWTVATAITGEVLYAGDPVVGADVFGFVEVEGVWVTALTAKTKADGSYRLVGTDSTKQYRVAVAADGFVPGFYDGQPDIDAADSVAHNATAVDFELVAL